MDDADKKNGQPQGLSLFRYRNLKNSYTFNKLKRDPSPYPPRSMADSPRFNGEREA